MESRWHTMGPMSVTKKLRILYLTNPKLILRLKMLLAVLLLILFVVVIWFHQRPDDYLTVKYALCDLKPCSRSPLVSSFPGYQVISHRAGLTNIVTAMAAALKNSQKVVPINETLVLVEPDCSSHLHDPLEDFFDLNKMSQCINRKIVSTSTSCFQKGELIPHKKNFGDGMGLIDPKYFRCIFYKLDYDTLLAELLLGCKTVITIHIRLEDDWLLHAKKKNLKVTPLDVVNRGLQTLSRDTTRPSQGNDYCIFTLHGIVRGLQTPTSILRTNSRLQNLKLKVSYNEASRVDQLLALNADYSFATESRSSFIIFVDTIRKLDGKQPVSYLRTQDDFLQAANNITNQPASSGER